ncbi:MAG: hypothetical protein A3E82_01680 [Gammaproteobacteria bacterium RIFCSPHIGHO2_12_FULL_38_11]|nr:MAG: hypothetical protein A3E82_01680 [Gammaproteobacteria bacterium RIFCSPHIGHO2_12_FULL_38_11]
MDDREKQSIAIVGMAFRLPGNLSSLEALWNALIDGKNLISEIDDARFPSKKYLHPRKSELGKSYTFKAGMLSKISEFDAGFFGISPREAYQMDPQQRLLLELTWEALENGNQNPEQLAGSNCAVFIGIASNEHIFKCNTDVLADAYTMLGNCNSIASNRISYVLDLHGPSFSIDTACSSSMVALHQACQSIHNGEASSAIVGGVNCLLSPAAFVGFSKAMMLSPDGTCKSFDANGNGYVRSEGCIVLYLKPLKEAKKNGDPIHGVILNTGINSDGRTNGIALPSATAQAALITQVHEQIGLSANDISYVEAHGTGTPVGDPIEAHAIGNAIGKKRRENNPLLIGSIKSNIGHLETASGLAGILKALLCFKYKMIPATNHFKTPNPNIDFQNLNLSVVDCSTDLPKQKNPVIIAVNSFGFGGANAHAVLAEYIKQQEQTKSALIPPLLFSARDEASFPILAAQYQDLLTKNLENYYDIAYTLAHRRAHHNHNITIYGDNLKIILDNLEKIKQGDTQSLNLVKGQNIGKELPLALVYSGNGSQWQGMGHELIKQEPVFEKCIDEIDLLFLKYGNFSIKAELLKSAENSRYHLTEMAQPCLFALQVAMTNYLLAQGVIVKAVLGHSIGEITAAWASGALTLAQAVEVIYVRSFWQGKTRGNGKMAAIALSITDTQKILFDLGLSEEIEISAVNSPKGVTVSGELSTLEKLKSTCMKKNIFYTILDLDYAFHSKYMDSIQEDLLSELSNLKPQKERIRYVSTVDGKSLSGDKLSANYWWRNIRKPVQLQSAINELITDGFKLFIEVGPHPVLKRYLDDCLTAKEVKGLVAPTMKRNMGTLQEIDGAIFKMWISGAEFNLERWFPVVGNHITLPTYPWIKQEYWLKASDENSDPNNLVIEHPLLGYRIKQNEPAWENHLDPSVVPYLADHVVSGLSVMPAAGYVEMAFAAAKIWHNFKSFDVRDIEILAPMIFDNAACRSIRFSLQTDDGSFQIKSRLRHSNEAWTLHAVGRILNEPAYTPTQKINLALGKLKKKADIILNKENFYTKAEKMGLSYGPTFQSIENIWIKAALGLATVKLHQDLLENYEQYSLHPALLDACFQMLVGWNNKKYEMLLPVRIGRIKIFGQFYGELKIVSYILKQNKQSVSGNVYIINKNNFIIAEMSDCRFKSIYLNKQTASCKNYICKPHLLSINGNAKKNIRLLEFSRNQTEKGLASTEKSSDHFQIIIPLFELMIGQFVCNALKTLADQKTDFSFDMLCSFAKIAKSQQPLLKHCLNILIEDDYLRESEDGCFNFIEQDKIVDPTATWLALLRDYPNTISELTIVGRCGFHLQDILCGRTKPEKIFHIGPATITSAHDIIISAVRSLLKKWPLKKRRLRILEIAKVPDNLTTRLLNLLPEKTTDYYLAVTNEHESIKAKNNTENHIVKKVILFNLNSSFIEQFSNDQRFDFVIVRHCLNACENSEKTLRELNKILTANSIILVEENYIDRIKTFIFTVAMPDLREKHFTPRYCQQLLAQSGFSVAEPLYEPSASEFEGTFVMMAQPLQVPELLINNEEFQWLILTDNTEIIAPLIDALKKRQSKIFITTIENTLESIQNLLTQFTKNQDKLHIVQMMGIHAKSQNICESPLFSVENHCGVLIHLIKAMQNLAWTTYPQLSIVTQGGALCDSDNMLSLTKNPEHAALWGFGRVLMNEHPELQCQLIDLQSKTLIKLSTRFVDELLNPYKENEIIITESASYGLRTTEINARFISKNKQNSFHLDFSRPGPLKNLQWFPLEKSQLAKDEVAVKPHASGLNFRDVMYSMGLIPDEALEDGFLGQTLGMEFAGEILAVGNNVTDFVKGDKVMGFAPASFSSYAITKAYAVTPLPNTWNYSAGASIPIAFFTAYYALTHLARIQPGERLLIHGAAGGVGIAAIQLAQHLSVEIYATAGSDEKRDFLTLLGIKHIYNSRNLTFADQIMEQTKGDGIDVVLNCLSGEAISSNLNIMKPFGRFLELGKRDFYANSKIGLRPFRNNISYFGIDADQLIVKNPALSNKLFKEMFNLFDQGILSPLPYKEFSADDVHDAFRYMQQSRHIGKIIINFSKPPTSNFALAENSKTLTLNSNATYLVTGGLNGFGFRTAQWLAEKGAKQLVLLGRSSVNSETIIPAIAELTHLGIDVQVKALDITDAEALNNLLSEIKNTMPPLKGIFHAAAVYDDAIITNLTDEKMHRVLAPKLLGAWHLHQASIEHQLSLDYFVVYSSVTTLLGNPGQANYVAANAFLESLMSMRRASNMPGFYVAWGAIDDVGYLARNNDMKQTLTEKMGMPVLTSTQALASLEQLLLEQHNHTGAIISDLNTKTLKRFINAGSSKFELLFSNEDEADSQHNEKHTNIRQKITDGTLTENDVVEMLRYEIGKILYIAPEKIDVNESLLSIGMDSLMGVELANAIEQSFGVAIPILALSQDPTINKLAKRLVAQLHKGEAPEQTNQSKEVQAILKIAAQHGETITEKQVIALLNEQSIEV